MSTLPNSTSRTNARSRVLDEGEYERLQAALDREENPGMRDFFMLALLTGARKANLLAMRWKNINFTSGTWTIPGETTKTGDQYIVALNDIDLVILKKWIVSAPGEYVFPGDKNQGHLADPKRAWARVLKRAKIQIYVFRTCGAVWLHGWQTAAQMHPSCREHLTTKTLRPLCWSMRTLQRTPSVMQGSTNASKRQQATSKCDSY